MGYYQVNKFVASEKFGCIVCGKTCRKGSHRAIIVLPSGGADEVCDGACLHHYLADCCSAPYAASYTKKELAKLTIGKVIIDFDNQQDVLFEAEESLTEPPTMDSMLGSLEETKEKLKQYQEAVSFLEQFSTPENVPQILQVIIGLMHEYDGELFAAIKETLAGGMSKGALVSAIGIAAMVKVEFEIENSDLLDGTCVCGKCEN